MNSSQNYASKSSAMKQNKVNPRASATPSRANASNLASRPLASHGSVPSRTRPPTSQPGPSSMRYGASIANSGQAIRPPAGLPSHLQRRPSATPTSSSFRSPIKPIMNKSPRYRKPPVSQTLLQSTPQKVTRPAVSCGNLDQKQRNEQKHYEQKQLELQQQQQQQQQQQEQQNRAEPSYEAGGDCVADLQQPLKEEEAPKLSFVERYMNFIREKLNDRQNEHRWDWPSSVVGDVKMDIARLLQHGDIDHSPDPARPKGHVTVLEDTCQMALQALRLRYDILSQEYNTLPMESDTLRTRNRRALLERELTQIEEGLLLFARNKVHVRDLGVTKT